MQTYTKDMYLANKAVRQGEQDIIPVGEIPADAKAVKPDAKGRVIVGHSESGHHHYFKHSGVTFYESADPFVAYLRLEQPAALEHNRQGDAHESISMPAGTYKVIKHTEYTPEGLRQVQD